MRISIVAFTIITVGFIACGESPVEKVVVEKWGNGNIKEERIFLTGDTVEITKYHENFKIDSQGKVVITSEGDVREGVWTAYYPDGHKWSLNEYKNGVLDGDYQTWHPNGAMKIKGHYNSGSETGVWQFLDTNGVVIRQFDVTPRGAE